ncbi:phosphatidylinositol dephosphorylation [Rhizoctonia solani]|uniref:phosphoinositide 5-phosphatase n=1 Tax=Rhizoctonia solani TaxID=456999 RepID=A0A8H7IKM0_9AGAM|nr:phosphatidylinositol dephosphorylation [Rhizoctonia solani]
MDSIIEEQRNTHEEIERFERALADILSRPQVTHKTNLIAEHKASAILDRMHSRMVTLNSLYMDEAGPRNQELEQLSSASAPDDLNDFYSKLKKIKDHHHKYPDSATNAFALELDSLVEGAVPGSEGVETDDSFSRLFSGEESFGRYVDLNANLTEYNNLKHSGKRFMPYLQYLTILAEVGAPDATGQLGAELGEKTRFSKEYETYLTNLHSYLSSFIRRTRPLQPHAQQQVDAEAEFNKLWEQNQIQGWDASGSAGGVTGSTSAEGIWCAACQRHYAKQTVYDAHLTSKKHIKAAARTSEQNPPPATNGNGPAAPESGATQSSSRKHIKTYRAALLTHLLGPILKTLHGTLLETKANVERRFSLTAHERELELEEPEVDIAPVTTGDAAEGAPAMEEEEEEERIYNPLKLPLGWDGKPIPYWLYKLHGLGVEYRCEICSDHVYMGRKNFDRHFQESRHAFGMRALGLPNTKHFHEITRIADALALAERLKHEGRQEIQQNETMEELEDEEGNVYNKKTYEDLKKQDAPHRALILVTSFDDESRLNRPRRALVFRAGEGAKANSQAIVEFPKKEDVDMAGMIRLTQYEVMDVWVLLVWEELFLAIVTSAAVIGNLTPNSARQEQVSKIREVAFFSLNSSTYDDLSLASNAPTSPTIGAYEMNDTYDRDPFGQQTQTAQPVYEHPCAALSKIMSSGTFYYASDGKWDISSRLQVRARRQVQHDHSTFDPRFIWNEYIVGSLMDFRSRLDSNERDELDTCHFIILAIQGHVGLHSIPLPAPPRSGGPAIATIGMISRLGWKRAGTRFNTRGVDDDGNVANFVETETLFATTDASWSYVQVRGSIPLFWEQQGLQIGGQRIQITRAQGASQPAFERHFAQLIEEYETVHIINLLGTKENEATLTSAYTAHLQTLRANGNAAVTMSNLDFHGLDGVQGGLNNYGFTSVEHTDNALITPQVGVFRTNCLDCLDRTNFIQDIISKLNLEHYLRNVRREWVSSGPLWSFHRELWAENGDALSRIYAGTGALNTSFTRTGKRTFAGLLADATKSVARSYINNFQDKGKQAAIDLLLGNMNTQQQVTISDLIHDSVRDALAQRVDEYSSPHKFQIFIGTWNLNGRPPVDKLLPWLFPRADSTEPDLFVLGFQEIVPLTAQQIVQTDPEKKRMWEDYILDTLATRRDRNTDYVVLRSEQGAVGIRLDYYDSSFCFVTAHLAAGHINVEERNSDYRTIANGLSFLRGKTISSHENVIWLADTNYRINLENNEVRYLAMNDQLGVLYDADQLKLAMEAQAAFMGYDEGPILFRPTYRYDLYSDEYDSSEKQRIPAWTDRVLYRGRGLDLAAYNRAELKQSDHRPIYAIFHATARVIDVAKKNALQAQLLGDLTHTNAAPPPPAPPRLPERPSRHNTLGPPEGILTISRTASSKPSAPSPQPKDPFDSDHEHSASSSEEELYRSSLMVPIEPTPISNSTVRAWPVKLPGSRSVSETRSTPDIAPQLTSDTHTLSSSTSFERVEIPNSLKEGGLRTATEEEVHRPVSVAARASMFEAKAKEVTSPTRPINGPQAFRSVSGITKTAPPKPPKPASLSSHSSP